MKRALRVLHAPSAVGGNPQSLSRALARLGVESRSLVVSQTYMAFPADIVLHHPGQSYLLRECKRILSIFLLLPRFDIVHYNAGTTIATAHAVPSGSRKGWRGRLRLVYSSYLRILQKFELAWVRALGKKVFVTYQGDDARQGDFSKANFPINIASRVDDTYYCPASDAFKRANIQRLSAIASQVYAVNPDLLHVLPPSTRFVPYSHVFMDQWLPSYTQDQARPLRIVHAPSHRRVKGTDLILDALARLKAKGVEFELVLVEGMSNEEARKLYAGADILIDQLFAGWYGGLAVEVMALGKPVMVYLREEDLRFIPPDMRQELPFIQVSPATVEESLRRTLTMPRADLVALGRKSRAFVERWHDPEKIAGQILSDYRAAMAGTDGGH